MKNFSMLALIFSVALPLSFTACAFKKDDSSVNAQDQRDDEVFSKLSAEYAAIEGLYTGTIDASDRPIPVELRMTTLKESAGTSSSGRTRFAPKIHAVMSYLDTLDDDVPMSADYRADNGNLVMASESILTKGDQSSNSSNTTFSSKSFNGTIDTANGKITGEIRNNQGLIGPVNLTLVSKRPSVLYDSQKYQRMQKLLEPAVGTYKTQYMLDKTPVEVVLVISVNSTNGTRPSLAVSCSFTGFMKQPMNVTFTPNPKPAVLNISEVSSSSSRECLFTNFSGYLIDDKLIGTANLRNGAGQPELTFVRTKN